MANIKALFFDSPADLLSTMMTDLFTVDVPSPGTASVTFAAGSFQSYNGWRMSTTVGPDNLAYFLLSGLASGQTVLARQLAAQLAGGTAMNKVVTTTQNSGATILTYFNDVIVVAFKNLIAAMTGGTWQAGNTVQDTDGTIVCSRCMWAGILKQGPSDFVAFSVSITMYKASTIVGSDSYNINGMVTAPVVAAGVGGAPDYSGLLTSINANLANIAMLDMDLTTNNGDVVATMRGGARIT